MPISYRLPNPDEPLQTTRQLAYCLAVLQTSGQEDNLSSDALTWRHRNMEEMDRFKAFTAGVVKEFADNSMKDASAVAEVVQLAPVLSNDHTRFLLNTFIDAVNGSEMLQIHSMEGLAKVIQGAAPGSINSNDLVVILRCLHKRLQPTHSEGASLSSSGRSFTDFGCDGGCTSWRCGSHQPP